MSLMTNRRGGFSRDGHARPGFSAIVRLRGMGGSALVAVMAIITAVLLVGVAIFILGHAEGDVVEYSVDDSRAFYIAEGGLDRMRSWLGDLEEDDPTADPVGTRFVSQTLGGGTYTAEVVADVSGGSWLDAYEVVSTGEIDGAVRQVKAVYVAETFARFQWFIESVGGGWSWFRTGERFEGPVHVNGDIGIDGDPWFGGIVRAAGGITIKPGSNPTFTRGYELGVDPIALPTRAEIHATVRAEAVSGGLHAGPLGNKTYYEVELGAPSDGWLTYTGHDESGSPIGLSSVVEISTLNGSAWFEEPIRIWGVLDGRLTIGVNGNIEIMDDIIYAGSTPGSGPDPDCNDVLGLIAAGHPDGDIIIRKTAPNMDNCEIHGVMMALQKNIEAEDYQHGPLRGNLTIYGSLIVDYAIHIAEYRDGVARSGYLRDFWYDNRLFLMPPPFFPYSGTYAIVSWEEVVPVVTS